MCAKCAEIFLVFWGCCQDVIGDRYGGIVERSSLLWYLQGWTENRGGATQVSSKRDISLICRPIGLKFGQNLLHSWFYDLTVRIVERKSQERDAHPEQRIRVCVILTLLFFLLILHVLPRLVNLEIAVLYASSWARENIVYSHYILIVEISEDPWFLLLNLGRFST